MNNNTTIKALTRLYNSLGGNSVDMDNVNTIPEAIDAISGYIGIKDTIVQAEKGTVELFGSKVSAMQTGIVVADNAITGTLKFIQGGLAASGPLAGDGNFLALKFVDENDADSIKVGLVPSLSNMQLVELDSDMNGVFKITGEINGTQQVLKVVTTKNGVNKTQTFDLSGLILNQE